MKKNEFKEKIRERNTSEQLNLLRTELSRVAEDLSVSVAQKEAVEKQRSIVLEEIANSEVILANKREALLQRQVDVIRDENLLETLWNDVLNSSIEIRDSLIDEVSVAESNLQQIENNIQINTDTLASVLDELKTTLSRLQEKKNELCLIKKDTERTREDGETVLKNVEETRNSLVEECNRLRSEKSNLLKELTNLELQVTIATGKITKPEEELKRRTQELEIRQRDVDIYADRVRSKWRELFPNKPFII